MRGEREDQREKENMSFIPNRKRTIAFKQANSIGSSFNCLKRYKTSFNRREIDFPVSFSN